MSLQWGEAYGNIWLPKRHKCIKGGRGSQKSHVAAEYVTTRANDETMRVVCARQFQSSIKNSSKSLIENKIISLGFRYDFEVTRDEIRSRKTGSSMSFIGLDRNPDSAKSLEGCKLCWVEEARNISNRSMTTLIPTIRDPGSEILWTWNPVDARDPIEKQFIIDPPDNMWLVHTTFADNPFFYNTEMVDEMRHLKKLDRRKWQHVWLGEYEDGSEVVIFPNVRVEETDISESLKPQFGLDFGMNADPNVLLRFHVVESIKTIYITHERYLACSTEKLMEHIDDVPGVRDHLIIADGSWPQSVATMRNHGFNILAADKGPGSVKAGIQWLQGYDIVIHPRCKHFAKEAKLYKWEVDRHTEKALNVPADKDNHCWDALRYGTERNRTTGPVKISRMKF